MVERPIKKSERQAAPETSSSRDRSTPSFDKPSKERSSREDRGKKGKGKGKRDKDEEPRQAVNPALLRGPKPVKAQPAPAEPVEEVTEEIAADAELETAAEDAETTAVEA